LLLCQKKKRKGDQITKDRGEITRLLNQQGLVNGADKECVPGVSALGEGRVCPGVMDSGGDEGLSKKYLRVGKMKG